MATYFDLCRERCALSTHVYTTGDHVTDTCCAYLLQTYSKEAVDCVQDELTKAQKTRKLATDIFEVSIQNGTTASPVTVCRQTIIFMVSLRIKKTPTYVYWCFSQPILAIIISIALY